MNLHFDKLLLLTYFLCLFGCTRDKAASNFNGYPESIGKIFLTKCATSGCHSDISKDAAGGLSLSSWDNLFKGGQNKAVVVPYKSDHSFLMLSINTYEDLGLSATPSMPYNSKPLSKSEVITVRDWINNGAVDANNVVKFSDNPLRKKIYVSNQGCDLVGIIDAQTKLIMRYVDVGNKITVESPHQVEVSPDGKYWYVIFYASSYIQKFNAANDAFIGEVSIGFGSWNTMTISSNGKYAIAVNWAANGTIAYVDLENLKLLYTYQGSDLLVWPHGSAAKNDFSTAYVTAQYGNFIYKINMTDPANPDIEKVSLETGLPPTAISKLDPHYCKISSDETKLFITCQKSNEIRVLNISNDSLLATISTGIFPQEVAFSNSTNHLLVTCTEDTATFPGKRGSVYIYDINTFSLLKSIFTGYQPHGVAVDEEEKSAYITHRNINTEGPAPHHSTTCGGRNGYMTIIDLINLALVPDYSSELSADPIYVDIRE